MAKEKKVRPVGAGERGPIPGEGGTPKKFITDEQIEQLKRLAQTGATQWEMATMVGLDIDTLKARMLDQPGVREAIEKGTANLKTSIRRKQIAVALDDENTSQATMLIWCGKVILGQTERVSVKMETQEDAVKALEGLFPGVDLTSLITGA